MEKNYEQLYDVNKLSRGLLIKGLLPYYVLLLLSQDKMYGKKILDRIKEMSGGSWKPSPGSIYPLLRRMVRLGLVLEHLDDANGHLKRIYELTEAGKTALAEMKQDIHPRLKRTIELLTVHLRELEKLED